MFFSVYLATVSLHSWLQSGEHSRDSSFRRKLQSILGSKENNILVHSRFNPYQCREYYNPHQILQKSIQRIVQSILDPTVALELQDSQVLINSLLFLVAEQNPLWNISWQYTLLGKEENNSAEKVGFLYASLPPPSCQKEEK